jgi:hypothetical protein
MKGKGTRMKDAEKDGKREAERINANRNAAHLKREKNSK